MIPKAVNELLRIYPGLEDLIALLCDLTDRPKQDTELEIKQHLASRVFFLLLGEIASAPNFVVLEERIRSRLQLPQHTLTELADVMATTVTSVDSAGIGRRSSLNDLPYPIRKAIFRRQGNRCAICGWDFSTREIESRSTASAQPTLDHKIPHRIGGDRDDNLWVVCGLCNSIKAENLHVGERGKVWIDNHVYMHRLQAVAFWTLMRDGRCKELNCGKEPSVSRLFVIRARNRGAWVLDSCTTRCEEHVIKDDAIVY